LLLFAYSAYRVNRFSPVLAAALPQECQSSVEALLRFRTSIPVPPAELCKPLSSKDVSRMAVVAVVGMAPAPVADVACMMLKTMLEKAVVVLPPDVVAPPAWKVRSGLFVES